MVFRAIVLLALCFVVKSDLVYNKKCADVDSSTCQVTRVDVENCSHAPRFCRVSGGKRYFTSVTFVPSFTADKLMLSTAVNADGRYLDLQVKKRVCEDHLLVCPLEPYVKQTLQFEFTVQDESLSGAYPTRVQLWNANNATEACCFSFKIKTV